MQRLKLCLATSVIAMGGFAVVPVHAADPAPSDTNTNTVRTDTNTNPNGSYTSTDVRTNTNNNNPAVAAPDADDIRKTVAKVTEDAVTKGDFHKLTKNLVDADYNRVKDFKSADNFAKLDGRIDEFQKDWKAKYNESFGFTSERKDVLNDQFAKITQGEIGEARTAGGKEMASPEPQNVKGGTPEDLKKSGVNQPDANSNKTFGGDTNREPGRNVATFAITSQIEGSASMQPGQMPSAKMDAQKQLDVPMIHELPDSWKIDIPDNIDGQKLQDNLLNHLTKFDEDRANWPADKNEAYRQATRHVLAALMESGS